MIPSTAGSAIVDAVTHWQDPAKLVEISRGLGDAMPGLEAGKADARGDAVAPGVVGWPLSGFWPCRATGRPTGRSSTPLVAEAVRSGRRTILIGSTAGTARRREFSHAPSDGSARTLRVGSVSGSLPAWQSLPRAPE